MRISDWSSVVCSSDLETPREAIDLAQQWRRHRFHCLDQAADSTDLGSGASGRNHAARLAGGDKRTGKGHDVLIGDASDQIGRASCRGRVCQYVSISVVAVSLKKKQYT